MEGVYISNYSLCIWNSVLTEHPLFAKSCNLGSWSRYLTLCLSFLTCKVRLRNTYLIGAVMRIRGVNIAKYLTQGLFVVQLLSPVWLFAIPWTAACQASLSFTVSWSLLKLMFIESVMLSNYLILCNPLLLLPSIFPSIRVFSNALALCIRWPKCWSFTIGPSNEHSELISFRIDWSDIFAV